MVSIEELIEDIFNTSNSYSDITLLRIFLAIFIAFVISLFIYYIYKATFKGVLYNKNFNIGLVLTALVTTMVMIPISSNITLSLGMVGALSIVRFRAAIKDPTDVIFTFWAVAVGITCGAALYIVAIIGTPMIGAIIYVMCKMDTLGVEPYLLVINYDTQIGNKYVEKKIQGILPRHKLRSKTVNSSGIEMMLEVRMKNGKTDTVDQLLAIPGVKNAALVSYNGDYAL